MSQITLRPFQHNLKADVKDEWMRGAENVMMVLQTGGGKSVVMSDFVYDGVHEGKTQAVLAHRNELVNQMSCHIAKRGIPHRIIGSDTTISQVVRSHKALFGQSFLNPSAPTAVVGVDTMIARQGSLGSWANQVDRWFGDEWHHCLKDNKWGKCVSLFSNAKQNLGVTATPQRADGQGLGRHSDGLMDSMVIGPSMRFLIDEGYLSDYEIVCPPSDLQTHEEEIGKSGDWSSRTLKKAAEKSHIVGDVVGNYVKYAYGRKAICFATDVETAGKIAEDFKMLGIPAAALSAKTNPLVREKYLDKFRSGELLVLVNVDLFDEGFDVPDCEVCIMARPTASLGKYRQMVGRVLRFVEGKTALIIDHVSNVIRHGLPERYIDWTLDRREKRAKSAPDPDDIKFTVCEGCTKPYEPFLTSCPHCGFIPPLPEPRVRNIEMVKGDLILLDKEKLAKLRESTQLEAPADLGRRVTAAAGVVPGKAAVNRQLEKIEAQKLLEEVIDQWAGFERHKGLGDREISKKFYMTLGFTTLEALDSSKTRSDYEKLTETVRGWYESSNRV